MKMYNQLSCSIVCIILSTISAQSSARSARSKCHNGVESIASGVRARYVTKVPTMKNDYGLVDDQFMMAVKLTEEFRYLQITLNFGTSEYDSPHITAKQLGLKMDGLWHQLWIDLEPTDLPGIDNWHLYIKSDQINMALDIDTGYVWHWKPYKPRLFRVYAKGKSFWIPRGDAIVCNAVDAEKRAAGYGNYGHLMLGDSSDAHSVLLMEKNLLKLLFLPLVLLMIIVGAQAVD